MNDNNKKEFFLAAPAWLPPAVADSGGGKKKFNFPPTIQSHTGHIRILTTKVNALLVSA